MAIADDEKTAHLVAGAPACQHIQLPGGAPLCGEATPSTEPLPPNGNAHMSTEQFRNWSEANLSAPACGSCLMLAGNLRFQAAVLRQATNENVYPQRPQDAWRLLSRTSWSRRIDLELAVPAMEERAMSYTWGDFEVDKQQLADHVAAHQAANAEAQRAAIARHAYEARQLRDRQRPDYENP